MGLNELRADLAFRTKRGLAFVWASLVLWVGVFFIWRLPLPGLFRNLLSIHCLVCQVPLAIFISSVIKAEFWIKDNPLQALGILFALNQFLYIPIALGVWPVSASQIVMILALISGAHLLPFYWLYQSRSYFIMSVLSPLTILFVSYKLPEEKVFLLAATMIVLKSVLVTWLAMENRRQDLEKTSDASSLN